MKKVLLLDDEKYVLKMLEEMIDWEFYGFCIVGCAENVKDVTNYISRIDEMIERKRSGLKKYLEIGSAQDE